MTLAIGSVSTATVAKSRLPEKRAATELAGAAVQPVRGEPGPAGRTGSLPEILLQVC